MSVKLFLVVALAAVSVSTSFAKNLEDSNSKDGPAPWYDCSGKPDGDYEHPKDCTKFISCVGQTQAYERDCAECHVNPLNCPEGRLHYSASLGRCEWTDVAGCTAKPEECTEDCSSGGDCDDYWVCYRGVKSQHKCANGLYWQVTPGGNEIHGGSCDLEANLTPETRQKYIDSGCIAVTTTPEPTTTEEPLPPCDWEEGGVCSAEYVYINVEKGTGRGGQRIRCPDELLWNQAVKSCDRCWNVNNSQTGVKCCEEAIGIVN